MKKRFVSEALAFVMWLLLYALVSAVCMPLSEAIAVPNSITAAGYIILCAALLVFLSKKGKLTYYGFVSLKKLDHKELLFYIPMAVLASSNLWAGIHINDTWLQIALISVCMACVGFIEEVVFRVFLMKALLNVNSTLAIVVSGCLFGVIHLMNLFMGADVLPTLLQVLYASSTGLMFAMFYYRTRNVIPCIICHSLFDIFDTFLPAVQSDAMQYIGCGIIILISGFYCIYLWKNKKIKRCDIQTG